MNWLFSPAISVPSCWSRDKILNVGSSLRSTPTSLCGLPRYTVTWLLRLDRDGSVRRDHDFPTCDFA